MKSLILIISLATCFALPGYAQKGESVVRKNTGKGHKVDTKAGYNYFLLDAVNDSDKIYMEYEQLVQKVWDGEIKQDLKGSSAGPLKQLREISEAVKITSVYKGGEDYQKAVYAYLEIVDKKVQQLEVLGILGADPDSDAREHNNVSIAFTDISNEGIDKRNVVRKLKREYEKTFYMKNK